MHDEIVASGFGHQVTRRVEEQMNLLVNDDVDYSEQVEYLVSNPPTEEEIKEKLSNISLQGV